MRVRGIKKRLKHQVQEKKFPIDSKIVAEMKLNLNQTRHASFLVPHSLFSETATKHEFVPKRCRGVPAYLEA